MQNSKNDGFLSIILCVLLIASTIGSSFGIKNSYAQAQLQTQQPSTLSQQPLTVLQQPLCRGGICDNNTTQPNKVDPRHAVVSSSQTFVNSKNLDLNHSFVSNKVVGPDRFRFVTSYWTTSTTSQVIDAGTSTNESRFITSIGSGVGAGPATYGWK